MKPAWLLLVMLTGAEMASLPGECPRPPQAGEPLAGLTPEQQARFAAGQAVFEQVFEPATGLGPLFNADACVECHEDPVPGGNGDEQETHAAVSRPGGECDLLLAHGGPVFQAHATPALTAALGIEREPIPAEATVRATRTSPDLFGLGLLEAVPDRVLLSLADPDDRDHDGISGRAHLTADGRVGRFGRKAAVAGLDEFTSGAFVIEMGITNPGAPAEESIGGAPVPPGVDPTPEPELSAEGVAVATDFVRFLAPPPPLRLTPAAAHGREVFRVEGCVRCHTPSLMTGANRVAALDHRVVHAYTDLLLHDMGAERADICVGNALPSEFRTEPLMGLRFAQRFLHDGAATTLEDAILMHGGEAAPARERYRRAPAGERDALLAFLRSL